jgi:potassium/sodium efflux P-type ATPase
MLTGDHPATAEAIAKEIGIIPYGVSSPGVVTTGPKMDAMTDEDLDNLPELPLIVARCSPESKVRMVEALHRRNKIAAMTGDGVNDSPAIKEADVGIAMGITGSDVTKGVADIVLADDNFATIVGAVQEGRRIFASISNFVMHLLSGNMAEAVVLLISLAYVRDSGNAPIFVLSPIAILYINTATGSGPAIGIALDDCAPDMMMRPPVLHGIFTLEAIADCLYYGFLMGGLSLLSFSLRLYVFGDGELGVDCNTTSGTGCETVLKARGCSFLALNCLLLIHAYNCRHQRLPFWKSPLNNKVLLWSMIIGTIICVPILYIPVLNTKVFKHVGGSWEWGMTATICVVFMAGAEVYKCFKRLLLTPLKTAYAADPNHVEITTIKVSEPCSVDDTNPSIEEKDLVPEINMVRKPSVRMVSAAAVHSRDGVLSKSSKKYSFHDIEVAASSYSTTRSSMDLAGRISFEARPDEQNLAVDKPVDECPKANEPAAL